VPCYGWHYFTGGKKPKLKRMAAYTGLHLQWNMFEMKEVERAGPFWWRSSITVSMASLTRLLGLIPAFHR